MAAHLKCVNYIHEMLDLAGCDKGYKVCILGALGLRKYTKSYLWKKYRLRFRRVSNYLIFCGFEPVTIDLTGRGNLHIDLGVPIEDESLLGVFDFVISFATIEHVEDQYELFRNIHNLCRVGGMVILNGPAVNTYRGHGTWTYDFGFFRSLIGGCGYMPLDVRMTSTRYNRVPGNYVIVYASYIKEEGSKFVSREDFKFPHYDPIGHESDKRLYDGCKRSEKVG